MCSKEHVSSFPCMPEYPGVALLCRGAGGSLLPNSFPQYHCTPPLHTWAHTMTSFYLASQRIWKMNSEQVHLQNLHPWELRKTCAYKSLEDPSGLCVKSSGIYLRPSPDPEGKSLSWIFSRKALGVGVAQHEEPEEAQEAGTRKSRMLLAT
jgi:hypothetical protein